VTAHSESGPAQTQSSAHPTAARSRRLQGNKARLQTALILLGLFLAAWLPRVWDLDAFVTPDERKWLARSANFYEAASEGNWTGTFQREHPGVTVMWAGTLGLLRLYPDYPANAPGPFAWDREHMEAWLAETGGPDPLDLLTAGRWWIVLAVSLAAALGYLPLRSLFGSWPAALAALWIAWDPFAIALSRQLHPDGLVSVLTFLALISFLAWLYGGRQTKWLMAAGITMGLAWLTKTPAIFLVPAGELLVLIEALRRNALSEVMSRGGGTWGEVAHRLSKLLRQREERQRQSEERLQEFLVALENSPNGVVLLDEQGRISAAGQGVDSDVTRAILKLLNDPSLEEVSSIMGEIGQGEEAAKTGVVVFPAGPESRSLSLMVSGLSTERSSIRDPKTGQPVLLRKTLRIDYRVPGERGTVQGDLPLADAETGQANPGWIMR